MCWPFRVTCFLCFDERNTPNLPGFRLVRMQWPVQGDNSRQDIMKSILYGCIQCVYVHMCMHVYTYIYIHTYICTYTIKYDTKILPQALWNSPGIEPLGYSSKPPQSAVSSASPVHVPSSLAVTVWVPECISRWSPQNRPGTLGTHPILKYPEHICFCHFRLCCRIRSSQARKKTNYNRMSTRN